MKISICTPIHQIPETKQFLKRIEDSLSSQTFQDFEWVITDEGKMAKNTNAAIKKAKGDIIKILYMDDCLAQVDSLEQIVNNFDKGWLASGCVHSDGEHIFNEHFPSWNDRMKEGMNTIGSPSVVAFENNNPLLFDEELSWMLDCDLYVRLYEKYGMPTLLDHVNVIIGLGDHQTTNKLSDKDKMYEFNYIINKHK